MARHLSVGHLTLLVGLILAAAGILILGAYALHKALAQARRPDSLEPKTPRTDNEEGFIFATLQGVIANLRAEQKELARQHRAEQERAEESARLNEIVTREMPTGLMVFDRQGFLVQANPAARALLEIDSWSRRRYPEILGVQSPLTACIRKGLEEGRSTPWEVLEVQNRRGGPRWLKVFLSQLSSQNGEINGVVCLVTGMAGKREPQE
jgi:PAS domain-containing protein